MFAYDKTFDSKVFLGHCDLISWFSDFALYLDTQLVFFSYFFLIMYSTAFVTFLNVSLHGVRDNCVAGVTATVPSVLSTFHYKRVQNSRRVHRVSRGTPRILFASNAEVNYVSRHC